jgi:glycine oxidase
MTGKYQHLIVGQGLAGTLLAIELMKHGRSVLVIDEGAPYTSSRVAAGMFTPVSGKRMAKSWMIDELYPVMRDTYKALEQQLGQSFFYEKNIQLSFSSIKEQNDFFSALDDKIGEYVITDVPPAEGLKAPFGCVEITHSGWVNTIVFLDAARQFLANNNAFIKATFEHDKLQYVNGTWTYDDVTAGQVIFCEGYKNKFNPFFRHVPIIDNKGDVFIFSTKVLSNEKMYKRGPYAVPLDNELFKAGSTYKWDTDDATPTPEGYTELKSRLDELVNGEYRITQHLAGIRPTSRDRRPVLGRHPEYEGLYIFSGLGTKGVLLAPYFSKTMARFVLDGTALNREIDASRFKK